MAGVVAETGLAALHAAKRELRRSLKASLNAMTAHERETESRTLVHKLLSCEEYAAATRVSVYLSMPDEVVTTGILEDLFSTGRACFIPYYDGPRMDMLRVHSMQEVLGLPKTKWNIPQPPERAGHEAALESGGLDLIVMPGLGFTRDGCRIGRGKGYYDTYLAKCFQAGYSPKTVALAFSRQLCEEIPMTDSDKRIDRVLFSNE